MADTTAEEVKRCPRCKEPGVSTSSRPSKSVRGAKLQNYKCMNKRCKWFETEWTVQVNADGTVPPPTTRREKFFGKVDPALAAQVESRAQAYLDESLRQGQGLR